MTTRCSTLAIQTGLRVSELIASTSATSSSGPARTSAATGKGRKQRIMPLTTADRRPSCAPGSPNEPDDQPIRCSHTNRPAAQPRRDRATLAKHAATAADDCPSLNNKRVTPTCSDTPPRWTPASRRRHHRHRPLVRPRAGRDDPDLPPRRPRDQGESARPNHPARRQARPLQATRPAPRVPRSPLRTSPSTAESRPRQHSEICRQPTARTRLLAASLSHSRHIQRVGIVPRAGNPPGWPANARLVRQVLLGTEQPEHSAAIS